VVFPLPKKARWRETKPDIGPEIRNRPQCRVTTPLWAPGADSGQLEKKTKSGAKFGPKNDCSARPWGRQAVTLMSESCIFIRLYRPLSKCFT
jgi:hypothetical protein